MGVKMTASTHWSRISYRSVRLLNENPPKMKKKWISHDLEWIKERHGCQNDRLDALISNLISVGPITQWKIPKMQKLVIFEGFASLCGEWWLMACGIAYHHFCEVKGHQYGQTGCHENAYRSQNLSFWTIIMAIGKAWMWFNYTTSTRPIRLHPQHINPPTPCVTPLPATCGRLAWNLYIYIYIYRR